MKIFLLFLFVPVILLVQPAQVAAQTKLKIIGAVSDSSKPLPLVTVRIFKKDKPAPLQTTLSGENGSFQLNKPDTGHYELRFTHTGFTEKRIDIAVTAQPEDLQTGTVILLPATGVLKEVMVKSQRPLVEQSDDKVVFNVEDDPASKTETAIDILRKTPFVTVDGEDNIKVNGKPGFLVLLNGRETSMFARNAKEALRGFPGALISKIEVITSPSAKYDGEGIGGLINIITRKKVVGYNGTLSTFSRTTDKLNEFSVNGNAKVGKFGFSVFYNAGHASPVLQQNTNTTIPVVTDVYNKRTLDGDQYASSGWSFGNAELNWEIDSLNTISLYSNINSFNNKTTSDQTITTDFLTGPSTVSYFNLTNKSNNPGVNVGSDYIRHFKKNKEREFSLRFLGEFGRNDSRLNSFQDNPGTDRFLINNSHAINNQFTIQADHSIPVTKNGKFEGGLKAIMRRANSDFESLIKYNDNENFKTNPANTDYFKYNQDVLSSYGMYSLKFKKFSYRFGARIEYTRVGGDFISSNTKVKDNYTTFLPNIQVTDRISSVSTLVFGYTKRLQRPYIWDLNPFVNNNDSLNISYGNPELGPQTVHALSANFRYGKGSTFAGINLEGTYSNDKILQYSSFDPQTGITNTTSLNIGREFGSGLNLNVSTKITSKWSVFVNSAVRFSKVTNNANTAQSNTGFGGNFFMNTVYRFTGKFSVSSFIAFWKDPQTIQTTYPFTTWYNITVNYKILREKVTVTLKTVNPFEKTRDFKTITKDQNFYNNNITTQIRRGAVLALTWNFGKLTENVSKKKGVNNDDLLTKPAAPSGN